MSKLKGHSYIQYGQLVDLKSRLEKTEVAILDKVNNNQYNADIGINGTRTIKDTVHFNQINNLKNVKADKVEFNSRDNQLTGNDTRHEEQMNFLESIYAGKVSKVQFSEMIKELKANDDSQDARLDLLEQQFNDIQSRIVNEVIDKANELVSKTDFNNMIAELEGKDIGIGNRIIQLASKTSIDSALASYSVQVSNLQDKVAYDSEIDKLVDRNHSFERRLMSVDQFFRVLAETYKLHRNGQEVIYNGELNSSLKNSDVVVNSYKTISSGQFNSVINTTINKYLYNTLRGPLKVFVNEMEVGFAVKSQFNENTRTSDVQLTSTVSSLKSSGFKIRQYNSNSTQVIQEWTFSPSQINTLPDTSPVFITAYNPSTFTYTTDQTISIPLPVVSGPVTSYSIDSKPSGLDFNNQTGLFGGKISTVGTYPITITASSSYGNTSQTSITIVIIYPSPIISVNPSSYIFTKDIAITSIQVNNTGGPVTSWSISPDNIGLSISSSGLITGVPNITGNQNITITAIGSSTVSTNITTVINERPPNISVNPSSYVFNQGGEITPIQVNNTGGPVTSWSISPDNIGLSISSTGLITGTLISIGSWNVTVTASGNGISSTNISIESKQQIFEYRSLGASPYIANTNGSVSTIVYAINGDIYIGGTFTLVENVLCNNIARWNNVASSWEALGSGANGTVRAIAISGSNVYVGGDFTSTGGVTANCIAMWTPGASPGTGSWSALSDGTANGVNNIVRTIVISGSNIYVGGQFTSAGGVTANRIAMWTPGASSGTGSWSALSDGTANGVNATVNAIAISGSNVYVGGQFTSAGGVTANRIAMWIPGTNSWSALGTGTANGVNSVVFAIAISGSNVYVGGQFTSAGGVNGRNCIAMWTPGSNSWSALGTGVNSTIQAIAISGSNVYVGGAFTSAGGVNGRNCIAMWTPGSNSWSALGTGVNSTVNAIAISGSDVYIGGEFNTVNSNLLCGCITKFNNGTYSNIGNALSIGSVSSSAIDSNGNVYIGGNFKFVNNIPCNNIAMWTPKNGDIPGSWSALMHSDGTNNGFSSQVNAIAISGFNVYVGGSFTTRGGTGAPDGMFNRIAMWTPGATKGTGTWSALMHSDGVNNGLNGTVRAITISGSNVYVGGFFTTRGGTGAPAGLYNRIAMWTPGATTGTGTWSALSDGTANGVNNTVYAIAISGSNVYAGGWLTSAGGVNGRNCIAMWTPGSTPGTGIWSALGTGTANGVNGSVYAIAISGSNVYVGGQFTTAGGVNGRNCIAMWTPGSTPGTGTWSALVHSDGNNGVSSIVYAIAISGSNVYVGGQFTTASGVTANRIARWTPGSTPGTGTWSALPDNNNDNGFNDIVNTISIKDNNIYTGGNFNMIGTNANKPMWNFANIVPIL